LCLISDSEDDLQISAHKLNKLVYKYEMTISTEDEELHTLYSSLNIITHIKSRRMRWAGHVARMEEESNVYKVLMRKPEGTRPLGRPRHRWENGIRMDLRDFGWGVEWTQLVGFWRHGFS
jgi:hypothetical protein